MKLVRVQHISAKGRAIRLVGGGLAAACIGLAGAVTRPLFDGPVHYEAVATLFVFLPLLLLGLTATQRRVRTKNYLLWVPVEFAWVLTIFMLVWFAIIKSMYDDMLAVMAAYYPISTILALKMLYLWQRYRRPMSGPYCTECAYCLIGAPTHNCPECGRPFTLEELGVTLEELQPRAGGV